MVGLEFLTVCIAMDRDRIPYANEIGGDPFRLYHSFILLFIEDITRSCEVSHTHLKKRLQLFSPQLDNSEVVLRPLLIG